MIFSWAKKNPNAIRRFFSSSVNSELKTALYDSHISVGAKMVPYAGYAMPLQYESGVKQEHLWCRSNASIFDVSHMGQVNVLGAERNEFMRKLIPANLDKLGNNQATLSVLLNKNGGIIDDTVVTKTEEQIEMVVNGACKHKDLEHMKQLLSTYGFDKTVKIDHRTDKALIAVQGPKAMSVVEQCLKADLKKLPFMYKSEETVFHTEQGAVDVGIVRCGYTGEDGFEVSMTNEDASKVWKTLMGFEEVKPAGLAARDSLRLEAGLCLYGNDMNEDISIVEAQLLWLFPKKERENLQSFLDEGLKGLNDPRFIGCEKTLEFVKNKPKLKRAGLLLKGPPAREGAEVFDEEQKVGYVSSGVFSPSLNKPIAMGYIPRTKKIGESLHVKVRKKMVEAEIVKMPFVEANYYRV
eukprot:augustus_masked-scaffold_2-processed-gene-25.52-mRNA-1 protein AED:0.02 eAED:0.02 QI:0/-1/0/1/-1/1/1/0/408